VDVNELGAKLASVDALLNGVADAGRIVSESESDTFSFSVPIEVLAGIDRGRNPQSVTLRMLEDLSDADATLRGKLHALNAFHVGLEKHKLEQASPKPGDS